MYIYTDGQEIVWKAKSKSNTNKEIFIIESKEHGRALAKGRRSFEIHCLSENCEDGKVRLKSVRVGGKWVYMDSDGSTQGESFDSGDSIDEDDKGFQFQFIEK